MHWLMYLLGLIGILPLDRHFKQRRKQLVDGFYLVELSADLRVQFTDLATQVLAIEDDVERVRNFIAMRLQMVAASLRTRSGVVVYDRYKPEHLARIASLPASQVNRFLEAACTLSAMQWMLPDNPEPEPTENPSKASTPAA